MKNLIERIEACKEHGEQIYKDYPDVTNVQFSIDDIESREELTEAGIHFQKKPEFDNAGYFRLYVPFHTEKFDSINIHVRTKEKYEIQYAKKETVTA